MSIRISTEVLPGLPFTHIAQGLFSISAWKCAHLYFVVCVCGVCKRVNDCLCFGFMFCMC